MTPATKSPSLPGDAPSRWPHRLAWALACATFPLVFMGGMVTSYGAGMAVEDWPLTFGHWWFPLSRWFPLYGNADWGIFLEHGHRTIGQIVGLLAIALVIALWRCDRRRWVRWLGVLALAGVCLQGALGGLRSHRQRGRAG